MELNSLRPPPKANLPRIDGVTVVHSGRELILPCLVRPGRGGPAILFVHGLGGAKENFTFAQQSRALADCTLVAPDFPGTGLAAFDPDAGLDVSALAELAHGVAEQLLPMPYYLVGASMGGLITLLQIRRHGLGRIQGLINIEGNLAPEDCMFSRRVASEPLDSFAGLFENMMRELRESRHLGDRLIAHNMEMNIDARAYRAFSFETVKESDSGRLLEDFLALPVPRLFLYGDANRALSYLPRLRTGPVEVQEIAGSAHFLFYDQPAATFAAIGEFVLRHAHRSASGLVAEH